MRKTAVVKVFVGSLIGFGAALVLFLVAGGLALASDSFVMNGPDVVGVRAGTFGWTMIGIAGLAVLIMVAAALGQFVAWIGAVLNTARLTDKTWFVVLLVGGLVSLAFPVTLAYVIAGPDADALVPVAPTGQVPLPAPAWQDQPPTVPSASAHRG